MKEYTYIGREHTESEKRQVNKQLHKWQEEGLLEVEGEIPKSPEMKAIIEEAQGMLGWKLQQLGIESESFDQRRIHLLPGFVYEEYFKDSDSAACFANTNNMICVNVDKFNDPLRLLESLLHEMIHVYSERNSVYAESDKKINPMLAKTRIGYEVRSPWKYKHHMVGFNEALTELTSLYLVDVFRVKIEDLLHITVGEERTVAYAEYMELVEDLVGKVSKTEHLDPYEVIDVMQKGMFTGSMLPVMKMLGRTIGREGVEILSYLGSFAHANPNQDTINSKVLEYFKETDDSKKQQVAKEIRDLEEEHQRSLQSIPQSPNQ